MPATDSLGSVLVIGGCGGLGNAIVKQLLEEKCTTNLTVFDIKTDVNCHEGARYIQGDLSSQSTVLSTIQLVRPQVTIHTASPKLMGFHDPNFFDKVNIDGTQNIIDSLKTLSKPNVLVYTSSSSVTHDNVSDIVNASEDRPLCLEPEQKEHYTHTKAIAEQIVLKANKQAELLTCAVRACTMFGEGDNTTTPPMIENAKTGRIKFQIGDNTNLFDFAYSGNVAHAHILAAQALLREAMSSTPIAEQSKVNGEAFNITNDDPWLFFDVPRAMAAAAGYPVKKEDIRRVPVALYYIIAVILEWSVWAFSLGHEESKINRKMVRYLTMTRTFDITKAKTRLGYIPKVSMQEGIERSVKWYLANLMEKKDM